MRLWLLSLSFRLAVLRETQQVALHSELLDSLPQLHSNHEDKITMRLECKGSGGRPCQGPAHITVMVGFVLSQRYRLEFS